MKFLAILAGTIALVSAQKGTSSPAKAPAKGSGGMQMPNIPSCGMSCMFTMISGGTGGCGFTDQKCFCGLPALKTAMTECVPKSCTAKADVQAMYDMSNKMCGGAKGYTELKAPARF